MRQVTTATPAVLVLRPDRRVAKVFVDAMPTGRASSVGVIPDEINDFLSRYLVATKKFRAEAGSLRGG